MVGNESAIETRMMLLERALRYERVFTIGLALLVVALLWNQLVHRPREVLDVVRTRQLVVVDDEGRTRVRIAQDPADTDRRARSTGLTVFDNTGYERGGFSTFDDGSVVLALDAPHGVGHPMPDRIGLVVYPDGGTHINVLNNETLAVARLYTQADGSGGFQALKLDAPSKQILIRTLTYDGDQRESKPIGE